MLSAKRMLASVAVGAVMLCAAPAFAEPQITVQGEEAAHPNIVTAIREMKAAMKHMQEAPHDFGGHKAKAMEDTARAIHSLKAALYYRLKMDDAALDKVQ